MVSVIDISCSTDLLLALNPHGGRGVRPTVAIAAEGAKLNIFFAALSSHWVELESMTAGYLQYFNVVRSAPQCSLNVDESRIFQIGAAHVQFGKSTRLRLLDCLPEKKRHSSKIVIFRIGAAILVDHRLLIRERDHARDRLTVLASNPDFQLFSKAIA